MQPIVNIVKKILISLNIVIFLM